MVQRCRSPTAIKFLNSDKLGRYYQDDMFFGDIINGNIYHFNLNKENNISSSSSVGLLIKLSIAQMHFKEQYLEKNLVGLLTLRWDLKTIMALMITYMSLHSTKHREQYLE